MSDIEKRPDGTVHAVASADAGQEFVVPVTWQVYSTIKVRANSLAEAFGWANEHIDEIPLGDNTDYIDGSYEIAADCPEGCDCLNR